MLHNYFKELLQRNKILSVVAIEITNQCNLRCVHCYQEDRQERYKSNYLPLAVIKNIVDQLVELKTLRISLTGGEVFCHPDIIEIIDYIHSKNISVSILSNITLITSELLKKIVGKVHAIYTTIYGFDEKTYDTVTRVKGSYLRYEAAKKLIKDSDIYLEERTILLEQNSHQLDKMFECCTNIGVKIDVNPKNKYAQKCISNETCRRRYFMHSNMEKHTFDIDVSTIMEEKVCNICEDSLCITYTGDVIPCINLYYVLGNVYNEKINDIWHSSKIDQIRELTKYKYFKKCLICPDIKYNKFWCLATNYYETGDMHTPSEFSCNMCRDIKAVSAHENLD